LGDNLAGSFAVFVASSPTRRRFRWAGTVLALLVRRGPDRMAYWGRVAVQHGRQI
jgi:hypothetical protein